MQLFSYGGLTFGSVRIFIDIKHKKLPKMERTFSLFTISVNPLVLFLVCTESLFHAKSQQVIILIIFYSLVVAL